MAWRKTGTHKLVALKDVRRLTGLEPDQLLARTDTQRLDRIDDHGKREEFVRIPVEFLTEETAE